MSVVRICGLGTGEGVVCKLEIILQKIECPKVCPDSSILRDHVSRRCRKNMLDRGEQTLSFKCKLLTNACCDTLGFSWPAATPSAFQNSLFPASSSIALLKHLIAAFKYLEDFLGPSVS